MKNYEFIKIGSVWAYKSASHLSDGNFFIVIAFGIDNTKKYVLIKSILNNKTFLLKCSTLIKKYIYVRQDKSINKDMGIVFKKSLTSSERMEKLRNDYDESESQGKLSKNFFLIRRNKLIRRENKKLKKKDRQKFEYLKKENNDNFTIWLKKEFDVNLRNGTTTNPIRLFNNYIQVKQKTKNKWFFLHRIIISFCINSTVPKGYHVHHKNRIRQDNTINNLELLTKEEHAKIHNNNSILNY